MGIVQRDPDMERDHWEAEADYKRQAVMWDWPLFLLVFISGAWLGYSVRITITWSKESKEPKGK